MAKAAKKTTEVAVAGATSLLDIQAELAKEAASIQSRIGAPSGDFIRVTQDKKFVLPNGTKHDTLSVVILDFISSNQFHDRDYKKGEESPPACFAQGKSPKGLIPDPSSPVIQTQDKAGCDACPNNQWGSAGAGKACANLRILAVTEANSDEGARVYGLKVSKTATKSFDAYVSGLKAEFNTVPVGVVTTVYFDPDKSFPSLRFGDPSPNENIRMHMTKRKAALERLLTPMDVSSYEPLTPKKGKK